MSINKPEISLLEQAIKRLEEGIDRFFDNEDDAQIRDGLIQRFEFTYELGHKVLKRNLEYASPNPSEIDEMTFQDIIRTANEQDLLLGDWPTWRGFCDTRSKTSHTYDQDIALEVVEGIPRFIEEAIYLRNKLRERLE